MIDLNNKEEIKNLDPKKVYESTQMLSLQCKDILTQSSNLKFPDNYKDFNNIVICGMGGSAYAGHVVISLFKDTLNIPVFLNSDYSLPKFVDTNTLVILTSYSGSTEEILQNSKEAKERNAKIVILSSGGELQRISDNDTIPSLIFEPKNNPANQPRLGTGYIILGTISILEKLNLVNIDNIQTAIDLIESENSNIESLAKDVSQKIINKTPLIFASEFLEGNSHILRNQINETAKSFSSFHVVPELNHHLMEGLKYPESFKSIVLLFNSNLYLDKNQKRMKLTKDVVEKNNIEVIEVNPKGEDKLSQILYLLSFGGYLSLFMGLLYNEDPSLIPWVDYFKENLNK